MLQNATEFTNNDQKSTNSTAQNLPKLTNSYFCSHVISLRLQTKIQDTEKMFLNDMIGKGDIQQLCGPNFDSLLPHLSTCSYRLNKNTRIYTSIRDYLYVM